MKKIYIFLVSLLCVINLFAQTTNYGTGTVSLTTSGVAVMQNFNALPTSGSSNAASTLPIGWYASETGSGNNAIYNAGTGSSSTGDIWSFGILGTNALAERAYGGIQSSAMIPLIGAQLTNNLGSAMASIAVSYRGEQWRSAVSNRNTLLDSLFFEYSIDATSLTTGTWVRVSALKFAGFSFASTGAKDGNATGNFTAIAEQTITFGTAIPNAGTVWIRWVDFNASSSDDGLAIDDVSIKGTTASPTITVNPISLATFTQSIGTPSTTQNYTISGTNLTTGIVATPPINYEISNDGGTTWYTNVTPLTLSSNGTGGVTGQPVTIQTRLNATVGGTFTGNIDHTAAGATTTNIAVTGNTVANFYNNNSGTLDLVTSWGSNPDGTGANPTSLSQNLSLFIAKNNATASFGAVTSITGTGSKLIIGDGTNPMAVTIPSGNAVTGIIDVLNQGILICQDPTLPTLGSIMSGSTVNYDGATVAVPSANYFNLTLSNGANLAASAIANVSNTFNPGTTVTATSPSTILFNGTAAQTMPAFNYDSVAITNTTGVSTPGTAATIQCNRGLKVSGALVVVATDDLNLSSTISSMVIDATRTVTVNGRLLLKSLIAPTVPTSTLTVNSGGKYVVDANVGNSTGFIPAATYTSGSEILVLQGLPRLPTPIGGNVVWNNPTQGGIGSFVNSATNTISGNLTITNTGAFSLNNGTGGTGRTLNIGGNLIIDGGTYTPLGSPGSGATNQTINVTGNVIVSTGALNPSAGTVGTGAGTVSIGGNLNHTGGIIGGTQTAGSSVLNFNGSAAQTVSTSGFTGNTNLTINNTTGVTLTSGNIDLGIGTLTFTAGKLTLGANDATANTISGGSATSYAVTNGAGALKLNVPATTGTYNLPIGTATAYRPASINFTAAPIVGTLTARVVTGVPVGDAGLPLTETGLTSPFDAISAVAPDYWEINSTATGGTYNITLTGNGQTKVADFANTTLIKRDNAGTNWELQGTYVATTGSNTAPVMSRTGLTSFSQFAIGGAPSAVLPLTIINFNGIVSNGNVNLNWNTAQESSLLRYNIQKSSNGTTFTNIGQVAARNSAANTYTFTDVFNGATTFYRLQIESWNGQMKYSTIIAVNGKQKNIISVFPNPVKSIAFVSHSKATANASINIVNAQGKTIITQQVMEGATNTSVNSALLPVGIYTIIYKNNGATQQIKMLKN